MKAKVHPTDDVAAIGEDARGTPEGLKVTVLFSDLVGSIDLRDAANRRELISAFRKCVAKTVRRYDGGTLQFLGDGVLVYFGYPQAHEDDAERAVLAGLDLMAAALRLKEHFSVQARAGIATGPVVTKAIIGSVKALENGIAGEAPKHAVRMLKAAEPNDMVIADSTRKLLGNLFQFEDLDPKDSKGIALRRIEEIAEVPSERRMLLRIEIANLIIDFTSAHKKLADPRWLKNVKDLITDWTKGLVQVLNARSLMERATLELKSAIRKFDVAHGELIALLK